MENWEKAIDSAVSPAESNEAFFDDFIVSSDQNSFIVEYHSVLTPVNPYAFDIRQMPPGESLDIGSGTLSLCSIGTAYLSAEQNLEGDAVYRFYDAQLHEITDDRLADIETFGTTEAGGNFRHYPFPAVALFLECKGIEDLQLQDIRFFDSTTKRELISGYSSRGWQNHRLECSAHIPLWHCTPVDVVLEVSYGPSKIFEFVACVGEGFREGNFQCRLICVFDGVETYRNSSTRDKKVTEEFRKALPGEENSLFFFACQPAAMKMPVTFEFLDADENALPGGGTSTSGITHTAYVKCPLEKVVSIRARYRTCRQRILIHLSHIPGLPEENNTIGDLFDVRIPYVRLHDAAQVSEFLRRVLQLRSSGWSNPVPPNSINHMPFPQEFRKATVRDIARLYAEGGYLNVDIQNERLRLEYPIPLVERLKQVLQKLDR